MSLWTDEYEMQARSCFSRYPVLRSSFSVINRMIIQSVYLAGPIRADFFFGRGLRT